MEREGTHFLWLQGGPFFSLLSYRGPTLFLGSRPGFWTLVSVRVVRRDDDDLDVWVLVRHVPFSLVERAQLDFDLFGVTVLHFVEAPVRVCLQCLGRTKRKREDGQ